MDGNGANSNYMVTASQFLEQRNRETQNMLTDMEKPPKLEVTESSSDNEPDFDYGLILTVTFFGTLGFGMVAVMLAGLWYRLCEKRRPKNEEEEIQSDDQDYKHLQMISRSSSYNPPPNLDLASDKHVMGSDMENSLNGVTAGCRSYRLLNGQSEEVIEIKIEKADGDDGEDAGSSLGNFEPFLSCDQKKKNDERIEIDSFRSLSENSVARTRRSSKTKNHDFRQFGSHENFTSTLPPPSRKTSANGDHGCDGVSCDCGYNLPENLLYSASNIITSDAIRHSTCEVHKDENNGNKTSSKNNNSKKINNINNYNINNEIKDSISNFNHQKTSEATGSKSVIPSLELSHVQSSRLRSSGENCLHSSARPSRSDSTSPNSAASKSPSSSSQRSSARNNNTNNNNNSRHSSQTLKTNNTNNNNSNSNPGRQKSDERLYGSRASGIFDDNQRINSIESDSRDTSPIYGNLYCAATNSGDWYPDGKNRNSTFSPHHLKDNSQNSSRKIHRPSLTRQAQIFISVPSSRDQINKRSYQLPVKEPFPLSKTPPITVSHTFDMGEALSSCGNSDRHERLESTQPDSRPDNSPRTGNRNRKLNIFKRHHSANTSNEAYNAGSCETNANENSLTTLVQNSPKRSQEFLQVPNFQPGRGATLGPRSDALRRSSFGDRQHPAWKSAESYHMRPELRRSFDERMPHCHPCMNQKGPVFNHSTISLQQHLMSRERSESDEHFHPDNRRCSCVPANTPHVSSHNSSVDKQSPTNSRDSLPPLRFPLNQPEIKVTGSFSTLNKMSPLLEKKLENFMYFEKNNSINYAVTDNYFPAKKLPKNDEYSRSFDASCEDYHLYSQPKSSAPTISCPPAQMFEPTAFREDPNPMRLHLDTVATPCVEDNSSPGGLSPVSPSSPLATSGRQLWDLRATLEQSPSDNEDEDEEEECHYENMMEVEKQASFDMQDEAPDYPFNTHGLNRVLEPNLSHERPDGPISPRRKLPPTPICKNSVSSMGHAGLEPGRKPSLTIGVGRVPMFTAASFDSSGTPDSECSGTAQIVGARRKFSSSISITDDFNTEPECFSDSSHNVRRIRNSTSSYDAANLPSSAYLTTSANTEGDHHHHHHHHHHHPMHANGQEGKSKATLSAMNISQIGLQNRNSYALISREEDSLELDLLKEKIVRETERNKTSELAKSRRNAYHKRRSGQVSESLEFHGDEDPSVSSLTGYPVFIGADMNESLTSSGSLNDVDNDSSITVNRRLIPPSYRAVLPAGRDYSIDKKTDMIFREFLKTDNATILKMKYGFKSPRRMKHSPRNSPSARPMVQQEDSIEETEAESGEGEPNSLGMTSSKILSGRQTSDTKGTSDSGVHGGPNHLSVGYIPSSDVNSDWLTEEFLYRRTRRLLPPIKSQDSTSSDAHMPGSVHLSRNSSINKS